MQLSDTNIVVLDGDRGKNYPSPNELFNKGYCLFLSNKNIANHKLLTIDSTYITKEKHCALKQGSLTRNDVVLTTRGTVGNLLYVDSNFPLPCRINSGMVIIRSDETQFLQKYLFYYFQSPYVRNQIISLQTGSAQPQLPIKDIRQLEISLVPLDKQSHIVDILGSLDESIEILEKKIETLLQIYALEYKLLIANKATNAQLSDIALVETGKRPPVKESIQSVNFSIPIIGASSVMGYTNGVLYSEPILVIGRVGTHGVVQPLFKECWASDNTLVIKSEYYSYVYNVLSNIDYASINKGSTQPLITQTDIRNTPIYLPAKDELCFFEKKCSMTVISVYQTQIDKLKEAKQLYLKKFFG